MALTWEVDGTTKTTYHLTDGSNTKATITGLNEGIVDKLPSIESGTEIELSADVLPKKGGEVKLIEGEYTLKLANGIPTTETDAAGGYDVQPSGTTITFKKITNAYYTLGGESKNITCVSEKTDTEAAVTISGLKSGVTASDITYDSTFLNKEIKLKASALEQSPTNNSKVSFTTTADFTLALTTEGTDKVTAGGELDGAPTLEVTTPTEANATTTTAKVQQKLTTGWKAAPTGAENNVKFVYIEAGTDTLATIENINKAAVAGTNISLSGKTVTLSQGALVTGTGTVQPITLTRETPTNLKGNYGTTEQTTAAVAYELGLDASSVNTDSNADGGVKTEVASTQATIKPIRAEYWTLSGNGSNQNTKITYTEPATGTAVVTVSGLGTGAKGGDNLTSGETANVIFDTSSQTITLKEGALPTGSNGAEVELTVASGTTGYDNYQLAVDGIAASGKEKPTPTLATLIDAEGKLLIQSTPSAGWDLTDTSNTGYYKKLVYYVPEALTVAEISGLKANTTISDTIAKLGTDGTITLFTGALDTNKPETKLTNNKPAGYTSYTYKLALDNGVTKYGADNTKKVPKLSVATVDSEDSANNTALANTKTAKITVTESAGWTLKDDTTVTYAADTDVLLAKVTGLDGTNATAEVTNANVKLNGKTITLSKGALKSGDGTTAYTVDLTEGSTTAYEKDYVLALDADSTKTDSYVPAPAASYTGTPTVTIASGTATIQASKAEGWTLDTTENSTSKNRKVTYTPATAATTEIAKITGLNDTLTEVSGKITVDGKNIKLAKDAFKFDATQVNNYADVELDNEDIGDFSLNLDGATENKFGGGETHGWAVDGTTAYYNQGTAESWTLGTPATGDTKVTSVTYTAAIANNNNEKAKHLITIANLASGITVGAKDTNTGTAEDSAVGTKDGGTFTPGLYISTDYVAATEASGGNAATPESKGELTLNRNVLDQGTKEKTITIAGDDAAKYQFALADSTTANNYVPTEARTKYFWNFNGTGETGTAIYNQSTAKYWAINTDKNSLTYTPETTAKTVARITGLKKELYAVNADEFDTSKVGTSSVITGSFISDSENGTNHLIEATKNYKKEVADDPATTAVNEAQAAVYGEITLKKGALTGKDVAMTSDNYGLALFTTDGDDKVDAPNFSNGAWALNGTTATYTANSTEGYSLNNATEIKKEDGSVEATLNKGVAYTAAGNHEIATITGLSLKSGDTLTANGKVGDAAGVTLTEDAKTIELTENVLGTTPITLTNNLNLGYKLKLAADILDYSDATDKAAIEKGQDVWRLNNTTAYYRHITPEYYTLADDGSGVTYTAEVQPPNGLYATVTGLKSGLKQGIGTAGTSVSAIVAPGSPNTVVLEVTTPYDSTKADTYGVITVKEGALDKKALLLSTSNSAKYQFDLDSAVKKATLTEAPTWSVTRGTATLTGKTTEGWAEQATSEKKAENHPVRINYYAANIDGKKLATLTGLATNVQANKLTAPTAAATDTAFELTADMLTNTDAVLTNDTLPDGTALKYTIQFKDAENKNSDAINGDHRWYIESSALKFGKVHDAHYEDSNVTDGVYKGDKAIDKQTIKYIKEKRETPDFTINNLASGVTLNSDTTYYTGNTPVKYDTAKTDGITLSDKTVKVKRAVLSQDASKPTEIVNSDAVVSTAWYKLAGDTSDVNTPKNNQEMLSFSNGTLTYYKGKGDGFSTANTDKGNKLTYVAADTATADNTVATVTGLKSDLKLPDNENAKLVDSEGKDAVTRSSATFTVNKNAVDTSASKKVVVTGSGTLELGTYAASTNEQGFKDTDKPKEANGWTVSGTTATFNKGKTAGWELVNNTEDTDNGNIVYREADYATKTDSEGKSTNTLFTLSDLKSGLKFETVKTGVTNKSGNYADKDNIAALVDNKGNVAVAIDEKAITLTSYAFNKKNVLFKDSDSSADYTLEVYANPATTTKKDNKGNTVTEHVDGYVANTTATPAWAKVADNKATYTVTITEGYDVDNNAETLSAEDTAAGKTASYDKRVVYTKAGKTTATLTGINASATLTNITVSDNGQNQEGTITVPTSVLNKASVKLANSGSKYTLVLGDTTNYEDGKVWNVSKGTATYVQKYKANSYVQNGEYDITYSEAAKEVPLVVVTGLDKTLEATEEGKGVSDTDAATKYGIKAEYVSGSSNTEPGAQATQTQEPYTKITLSDRTKLAAGDVKLTSKDGGLYEFNVTSSAMTNGTDAVNTNLGTIKYSETAPLWSYSKGTVTLATGDSGSWAYGTKTDATTKKTVSDQTVLKYSKPDMKTVATISGLNTSLALHGNAVKSTTTTTTNGTTTTTIGSQVIALGTATTGDAIPIQIDKQALVAAPKKNAKVTLKLTNDGKYALANSLIDANKATEATKGDEEWSISKGTATYQYTTSAGWNFAADGKTVTYTDAVPTVLVKITGLNKDLTTIVTDKDGKVTSSTKSPSDKIVSDKTTDVTYSSIIEVNDNLETDAGGKLTTFTLKNKDYLAGSKVTLSPIDKKSGTTYQLFADEVIKSDTYEAKWTADGKKGSATLAAGTDAGYDNPKETDKAYGTTVNYVPAKANTVLATITGLKKDDSNATADNKLETLVVTKGALTADTLNKKILLNNEAILGTTTVTLGGKGGYSFDADSLKEASTKAGNNTKIDADNAPQLKAKSGTVTLVDVTGKGKFALSSDGKKLVVNTKKDTETVLATVKGLNKTLVNFDGEIGSKVVTSTTTGKGKEAVTTPGTTEVVSYENGVITLNKDALANSNITFTLGKGVEKGTYTLALGEGVLTESSDYGDKEGWTISNGTATYKKNYDYGYYEESSKGYTYHKETKGTPYATISGLNKDFTDASALNASDGLYSEVKITKDMLAGKNVTLSNKKVGSTSGAFTLALDTTGMTDKEKSTLGNFEWKGGKLTATQSEGYLQASDTSITFLKKDKEKQAVATITGLSKDATIARKPTKADDNLEIVLNKADLAGKNVTITTTNLTTGNYTLKLGSDAPKSTITANANADDPWSVKSGTATYSGYMTEGYKETAGGKTITYTKAAGSALVPATDTKKEKPAVYKALTTIKGVTESTAPKSTNTTLTAGGGTVSLDANNVTLGSGLFDVNYGGTNITGSKDADTIKLSNTGSVTVNGAKGDDSIDLGSAKANIVYANGDGYDVITGFSSDDTISIPKSVVSASDVKVKDGKTIITVGKGAIQLEGYSNAVNIVDKNGTHSYGNTASDVLFADDNYSMDAAALSDIVEPFKASYTPYDFETGLDLVKKDSFAPALTFTGTSDKK